MKRFVRMLGLPLLALLLLVSFAVPASADTPAGGSIASVAALAKPSVVGILTTLKAERSTHSGHAAGTGFVYKDGVIITNAHVVAGATEVKILYSDKTVETVAPKNIFSDSVSDIAVITVAAKNLVPLPLSTGQPQVGQQVIAIGNPLGFRLGNSVTAGILSGTGRAIGSGYPLLQTDAAINPGNSGGPLLDLTGQVIGINSAKMAEYGVEGLGFAIPIQTAVKIADQLLANGKVVRATLGIFLAEGWEASFGVPNTEGVTISRIVDDGPLGQTGLHPGDKLVKLDDTPIYTSDDYYMYLDTKKPGDMVTVTVKRRGQTLQTTVKLISPDDLRKAAEDQGTQRTGILINMTTSQIQEAAEFGRNLSQGYAYVNRDYFAVSGSNYAALYTEYMYVARRIASAYEFGFTPGAGFQQQVAKEINSMVEVQMELTGSQANFAQDATFTLTQDGIKPITGGLWGSVQYTTSADGKVVIADLNAAFPTGSIDPSKPITVTVTLASGTSMQFQFDLSTLR